MIECSDVQPEAERTDGAPRAGLSVVVATRPAEIHQAQQLRYAVFGEELGARVPGSAAGVDCDRFDRFCDHLIVREEASGAVIGTYRMLSPSGRRQAGAWYCSGEFEVGRLERFAAETVEIGRA